MALPSAQQVQHLNMKWWNKDIIEKSNKLSFSFFFTNY